jgi:hypothetical protein
MTKCTTEFICIIFCRQELICKYVAPKSMAPTLCGPISVVAICRRPTWTPMFFFVLEGKCRTFLYLIAYQGWQRPGLQFTYIKAGQCPTMKKRREKGKKETVINFRRGYLFHFHLNRVIYPPKKFTAAVFCCQICLSRFIYLFSLKVQEAFICFYLNGVSQVGHLFVRLVYLF